MKKFDYQAELKRIVEAKQLVQIHFVDSPSEFHVAYIMAADDDFIVTAEISDSAIFDGVVIYRAEDIVMIKVETIYLGVLEKLIETESIYKQARAAIGHISEYSFAGFIEGFVGTNKILEIVSGQDEGRAGRIRGFDKKMLAFDEYRIESDARLARSFLKIESINSIAVDVPWLRVVSSAVSEK